LAGARTNDGAVTLAFCWSHVRRGFYDLARPAQAKAKAHAPIAIEALRRIDALYKVEEPIRGKDADHRLATRQAESKPLVADLRIWFEKQIAKPERDRVRTHRLRFYSPI
jgi:transposase